MADLHDSFFKAVFGQAHLAADLLRVIGPPSMMDAIDAATLVPAPTESVDASLATRRADLLFEASTRDGAPLMFQLEHQSRPDDQMALRLLLYATRALQRWRHDGPRTPMPLVVSRVVYNGPTAWAPRDLSLHVGRSLRRYRDEGPEYPIRMVDVADLRRAPGLSGLARLAVCALYVGTRPHLPLVGVLASPIRALAETPSKPGDLHVIEAFLRYTCSVRAAEDDALAHDLISLFPQPYNDMAQTTWDWAQERARDEGRQQGVELGLQQGVELGLQQGVELGLQQGVELGLQQGVELRREALREAARRLGAAAVDVSLICEATGLTEKEVRDALAES